MGHCYTEFRDLPLIKAPLTDDRQSQKRKPMPSMNEFMDFTSQKDQDSLPSLACLSPLHPSCRRSSPHVVLEVTYVLLLSQYLHTQKEME